MPKFFSIPTLIYWFNEHRTDINILYDFDENKLTAFAERNIIPLWFKHKHKYHANKKSIAQEEFQNLVEFEIRHPFIRSFARLLFYAHKLPYPKIEF